MSRPPNTTEASNDHHSDFGDFDEALASPCLRDPPVDEREHHSRRSDLGMNDSRAVSPDNNVRYQGRSGLRSHSTGHRRKASLSPATVRQRELSASPAPQGQETIPITGPAAHHHQQQQQRRRQPQAKVRRPFSRARWLARAKKRIRNGLDGFWSRNKGLALVFMSQFFGTLMNVTTRILEKEGNEGKGMHPFQILFARMSITVTLASLYMWWTRTEHFPLGMREVRPLLVARGIGGFFGVFGLYYSLQYLPLADATVITFLAPSLACWACSFLIDEPFTRMEQMAAYVSLFGVVLIARPTSLFSSLANDVPAGGIPDIMSASVNSTQVDASSGGNNEVTPSQRAGAVAVAMVGVLGAASAYTTIRWIGKRAHPLISVNYFAAWCTIVSTTMMLALPGIGFVLPANAREWFLLVSLGLCGFIMQFLLAAGLQYERSSRATNMVYSQMLFALAFDKLIWGTTPGTLSIVGSTLILGSAIYVAVHKERVKSREADRSVADEEQALVNGMEEDVEGEEDELAPEVRLDSVRA